MKIVLATGIYPPDIGGPATYVKHLADELTRMGHSVFVVTYGNPVSQQETSVTVVPKSLPVFRWFKYAKALRKNAADADVVYAFSSVSVGVPLKLANLHKPKKILRLGGDFFWERYTDMGGTKSLREWYKSGYMLRKKVMSFILNTFDHIVFSTRFQEEIYEQSYNKLPNHSVIENALVLTPANPAPKSNNQKLLFMGRLVQFKNILSLLKAVQLLPDVRLTVVGDGPQKEALLKYVQDHNLESRVVFTAPVHEEEKQKMFASHDLLVLPSYTEISPNVALEASAAGLPVLLTKETGLSTELSRHMVLADLRTPESIAEAIRSVSTQPLSSIDSREWSSVATEHDILFAQLSAN